METNGEHACVIEIRFLKHTKKPVKAYMYATMHVADGWFLLNSQGQQTRTAFQVIWAKEHP